MKMLTTILRTLSLLLTVGAAGAQVAPALPFLSPVFGDNMVLQRGKPDAIWGWAEPGTTVQVQMGNSTAKAVAAADRRWQVKLDPPPAGGP